MMFEGLRSCERCPGRGGNARRSRAEAQMPRRGPRGAASPAPDHTRASRRAGFEDERHAGRARSARRPPHDVWDGRGGTGAPPWSRRRARRWSLGFPEQLHDAAAAAPRSRPKIHRPPRRRTRRVRWGERHGASAPRKCFSDSAAQPGIAPARGDELTVRPRLHDRARSSTRMRVPFHGLQIASDRGAPAHGPAQAPVIPSLARRGSGPALPDQRARAMRCLWPPERRLPFWPTTVA